MGTPFASIPRKIAIPLIGLTAIGWLLVVIAFGIGANEDEASIPVDRSDPASYHFWMVSFCGPIIISTALIHAALWKPISSILGAITSFLSVLFLTALGMLLFVHGELIRRLNDTDETIPDYVSLAFAGSLIATLFWTLLMILWLFYDESTSEANTPFQGIARKIVLPFIVLTGVGWLLVVIGFGIGTNKDESDVPPIFLFGNDRSEPTSYLYWVVCFSGPFVFVTAVIHAALWKPIGSIFGAFMVFLNAIFLTGLGMILFLNGNVIRQINDAIFDIDVPAFYALEFAGAFLATLFWTPVMVLWHYYDVDGHGETKA